MRKKEFISNSKEETWKIAGNLLNNLDGNNLVVLKGELGSGKTTFTQGILKTLEAKGPFTSPTFVIMKHYKLHLDFPFTKRREEKKSKIKNKNYRLKAVYHLDCYRVGAKDVSELGWEEIVNNKNNLVLVEWPERIRSILPEKYLQLEFKILGENKRKIVFKRKQY